MAHLHVVQQPPAHAVGPGLPPDEDAGDVVPLQAGEAQKPGLIRKDPDLRLGQGGPDLLQMPQPVGGRDEVVGLPVGVQPDRRHGGQVRRFQASDHVRVSPFRQGPCEVRS